MKKQFVLSITALAVVTLLFTACGKFPQAEVDQATLSIDNAKAAGADIYLPEAFTSLQDSMLSVMEGIEAQKSKLFKNYSNAKDELASIDKYASEVMVNTEERKVELKNEIQTTLSEVIVLLEENKRLISEAPKGKEGTTALVAMKNEISTLETSVNKANLMLQEGDYLNTYDMVKSTKDQATALNTELKDIITKYKANAKARRT